MSAAAAEPRARLAKLVGMLGSSHAGEVGNALEAVGQALARSGRSWTWVGELVARGELPGGEREQLLRRLLGEKLRECLARAWALEAGEGKAVRGMIERLEAGEDGIGLSELERVVAIADQARRRTGGR